MSRWEDARVELRLLPNVTRLRAKGTNCIHNKRGDTQGEELSHFDFILTAKTQWFSSGFLNSEKLGMDLCWLDSTILTLPQSLKNLLRKSHSTMCYLSINALFIGFG